MATIETGDKDWTEKNKRHTAIAKAGVAGKFKHPKEQGLFIRVSPKGKAVWAYKFRDAFGEEQADTLGQVGELTEGAYLSLTEAVKQFKAKYLYHTEKATPGNLTLAKGFADYLLNSKKKGGADKSPRTLGDYQGVYDRFLVNEGAALHLERATPIQWRDILDKAKAVSPQQARRAFWLVHGIYAYHMQLKVLKENPLNNELLRSRFSGDDTKVERDGQVAAVDLKAFVRGVMDLANKQSRDAILCLLLTSWRLAAVLRLRWDRINWATGVYTVLPGDIGWKGFKGPMALNTYVMGILEERYKARESTLAAYVFPSRHGNQEFMQDLRGSLVAACAAMDYVVTAHDLRRTYPTIGEVVLNGNTRLLGLLMGHKQPKEKDEAKQGSQMTNKYLKRNLAGERVGHTRRWYVPTQLVLGHSCARQTSRREVLPASM